MMEITEEQKFKKFNEALAAIMQLTPLIDLSEPVVAANHEVFYALAQFYSNEPLRKYIINKYKATLQETAQNSMDMTDLAAGKMRAMTWLELLAVGKRAYNDLERINKLKKKSK